MSAPTLPEICSSCATNGVVEGTCCYAAHDELAFKTQVRAEPEAYENNESVPPMYLPSWDELFDH